MFISNFTRKGFNTLVYSQILTFQILTNPIFAQCYINPCFTFLETCDIFLCHFWNPYFIITELFSNYSFHSFLPKKPWLSQVFCCFVFPQLRKYQTLDFLFQAHYNLQTISFSPE